MGKRSQSVFMQITGAVILGFTALCIVACGVLLWWNLRAPIISPEDDDYGDPFAIVDSGGQPRGDSAETVRQLMQLIPQVPAEQLPQQGPCCVCLDADNATDATATPRQRADSPAAEGLRCRRGSELTAAEQSGPPSAEDQEPGSEHPPQAGPGREDPPPARGAPPAAEDADSPVAAAELPATPSPQHRADTPDAGVPPAEDPTPNAPYGLPDRDVGAVRPRTWALLSCAERHPIHWDCLNAWLASRQRQALPLTCPSCRSLIRPIGEHGLDEVKAQ